MAFDFPASPVLDQEYVDDASGANYKYDGVTWLRMPSKAAAFEDAPADGQVYGRRNKDWQDLTTANTQSGAVSIGDVKTGFQPLDHAGWIKLDGRAITTLSLQQQTAAKALGFAVNLPNGANAVLVQNGLAMGAVSGTMSRTLTQANLPDVEIAEAADHSHAFTGDLSGSAGDHQHESRGGNGGGTGNFAQMDDNPQWFQNNTVIFLGSFVDTENRRFQHFTAGTHQHTVSGAVTDGGKHKHRTGGTGTALDITPRSISCNMFLYLGF
jgi:hypothetical protein